MLEGRGAELCFDQLISFCWDESEQAGRKEGFGDAHEREGVGGWLAVRVEGAGGRGFLLWRLCGGPRGGLRS